MGGLSADELATIRTGLDGGRRPRVQFTAAAGQIAGQIGQVVRLTDPAASDEWVVVRFGRDELPFSPGDLRIPPRGARSRAKPAVPPEPPKRPEPEFLIDKPVLPPARRKPSAAANGQAVRVAPPSDASSPAPPAPSGRSSPAPSGRSSPAAAPSGRTSDASPPSAPPAPAGRKPKSKVKPPPSLTVTLAYAEGEWTVAAAQGAKTLARPYVVKPAEAMRMVALVDVPGVQEAVEQIVAAERAAAEREADRLRAQLAEVESRLAELRDVPS